MTSGCSEHDSCKRCLTKSDRYWEEILMPNVVMGTISATSVHSFVRTLGGSFVNTSNDDEHIYHNFQLVAL